MRCPECDAPTVEADTLPPWGVDGFAAEWTLPPHWGFVFLLGTLCGLGGAALGVALSAHALLRVLAFVALVAIDTVLLFQVVPLPKWRPGSAREAAQAVWAAIMASGVILGLVANLDAMPLPGAVLFGCLGIGLGTLLTYLNAARLTDRAACDPDASTFTTGSAGAIHNAPQGRVRVAGRVRVERFATQPDGTLCAAYERRIAAGRSVSIRTGGGILDLDDGSGSPARVLGEWVRVLDGAGLNTVAVLPDGAEVEVVGEGRWTTGSSPGAPLRGSARVLEISGSPERPVLLRTLQRAAPPSQGVRIATTPSARDDTADDGMDATVSPRQGAESSREG